MGAINKNLGDSFLIVWKLAEDKCQIQNNDEIVISDKDYCN
jgi:hypothetical protein